MWGSISDLEMFASIAFWVGVVSGGIALIAGAALTVTSDRIAALTKAEADVKIRNADARAAEANARAEEAKADAANAHRRAEEAGADAEKVRERLKKSQEMRQLTKPQADALTPLLKSDLFQKEPRPKLTLLHVSDAEAESLARQMLNLFKECDVKVAGFGEGWQTTPSISDFVLRVKSLEAVPENQPFARLQWAMINVGMTVGIMKDESLKIDHAELMVLRKPEV